MKQSSLKIYIETFGCQMNEYDSELIKGILESNGFNFVDSFNKADVIMLNTCTVRKHANDVVYNRVYRIRHELQDKKVLIGILGCMVSDQKQNLFNDDKMKIDFIAGPDSYKKLPSIINKLSNNDEKIYEYELDNKENYNHILPKRLKSINAWVAIMRGCNNFCSFCIVPYVRGRERSRPIKDINEEIDFLLKEEYKQVFLLGQNVNSYSFENHDFADLLSQMVKFEHLKRIRFMSPHPKDFPIKLLKVMKDNSKICKHIHLPLQAGSSRILKLMNRGYSKEEYLKLVNQIRSYIPNIVLTTDIIAGFPSETENEFEDTIEIVKEVRFDSAFIFKYSEREGTIASKKYKDDIKEEEKIDRVVRLNNIQKEISFNKNKSHIDETHEVLIEKDTTKRSIHDFQGRNDGNKIVIFPGSKNKIGDIVNVKIKDASANILKGVQENIY